MNEILIVSLSAALGLSLYINYNLYSKIRVIKTLAEYEIEERVIEFFTGVLNRVKRTKEDLHQVDRRGAFKADDEVGFTFTAINDIIKALETELTNINKKLHGEEEES